jgi:hypothetical protein
MSKKHLEGTILRRTKRGPGSLPQARDIAIERAIRKASLNRKQRRALDGAKREDWIRIARVMA